MTDYKALREAAEKATPGEWSHEPTSFNKLDRILYSNRSETMHGLNLMTLADGDWNHVNNVEFIALANPTVILSLLDALAASEARVEKAREALKAAESWFSNWGTHVPACEGHGKCTCAALGSKRTN